MIIKSIYALIATLTFGILFNIQGKKLAIASLGGGISWFAYLLAASYGKSNVLSLFIASLIAGVFSEAMARIMKTPVTTFVICAIIPLVPGGGMYYTMLDSIRGNINSSLNNGLETLTSAGAIAVGIILVSSTSKYITLIRANKKSKKTSRK